RRTQGEDGAPALRRPGQLDALGDRAAAVGVHLQLQPLAAQASIGSERHLLEARDLLDQHRDPHVAPRSSSKARRALPERKRSRTSLGSRRESSSERGRSNGISGKSLAKSTLSLPNVLRKCTKRSG